MAQNSLIKMFLLCDLFHMKIEVNDRIMKKLFKCHKFAEIGIPFCRIIHPAVPFVSFDGVDFFQQGEIGPVVYFSNPIASKKLSLSASPKGVYPVEGTGKGVQQPGEPSG